MPYDSAAMTTRRRITLALVYLGLLGLFVLLSGRPKNPLADWMFSSLVSSRLGAPLSLRGASIQLGGRMLQSDRFVLGKPKGFGSGHLATGSDLKIRFARPFGFSKAPQDVAAGQLALAIDVTGGGENSLVDALRGGANPVDSSIGVSIVNLEVTISDARSGLRTTLLCPRFTYKPSVDARGPILYVVGKCVTAERTGDLYVRLGRIVDPGDRSPTPGAIHPSMEAVTDALAIGLHGVDLSTLSPAFAPWFGGGSLTGICDFDLDYSWESKAQRLAISCSGELKQPSALLPALSPTVGIGESAIRLNGGIEIDLAKKRVRADSFRVESELFYANVDGAHSFESASGAATSSVSIERPLNGTVAISFDRGALRYGPLLQSWLRELGVVSVAGDFDARFGASASVERPPGPGTFPFSVTCERFVAALSNGRALRIGDAAFATNARFDAGDLTCSDVLFGTSAWNLRGEVAIARPFAPNRDLSMRLAGELLTQRLVAPIVAYAGSMPLQMNGEGVLTLEIQHTFPVFGGHVVYESADTDVRYDDLRPGVSDIWNFRGVPYRVEARFGIPRWPGSDPFDLAVEGRVTAQKAIILRDEFTDLDLPFTLANRHLTLGPLNAGYFGGRASGEVDIVFEKGLDPRVHARLDCEGAELRHFTALVGAAATGALAGPYAPLRTTGTNRVTGWLELDGRGDSMSAVLRTLTGNGVIEIGPGTIEGASLLDAWAPPATGDGRTIDSLRSSFFFEGGVLDSNDVLLRAGDRQLRLTGRCDPNGKLDFAIDESDWLGTALHGKLDGRLKPRAIGIRGHYSAPELHLPDVAAWERAPAAELDSLVAEFNRR